MAFSLICAASANEVKGDFFELVVGLPHQRTKLLDELFWNISTPGTNIFAISPKICCVTGTAVSINVFQYPRMRANP